MTPFCVATLVLAVLSAADILLPALASTTVAVAEPYEVNANETQVLVSRLMLGLDLHP